MNDMPEHNIDRVFTEGTEVDRALKQAVQEALLRHKLLGNPIAIWRDDRVCWLQPNEIPLPETDDDSDSPSQG